MDILTVTIGACEVRAVASDGQNRIAVGDADGRLNLWVLAGQPGSYTLAESGPAVHGVLFSESWLVSVHSDCSLKVWDLTVQQIAHELLGLKKEPYAVCQYQGMWVAAGAGVHLWVEDSGEEIGCVTAHHSAVTAIEATDRHLITGALAGEIRVWDTNTETETWKIVDGKPVKVMAPSGNVLNCLRTFAGHDGPVYNLCSVGPELFYSTSLGKEANLAFWNVTKAAPIIELSRGIGELCGFDIDEEGNIVVASFSGCVLTVSPTEERKSKYDGNLLAVYFVGNGVVSIGLNAVWTGTMQEPLTTKYDFPQVTSFFRAGEKTVIGQQNGNVTVLNGSDFNR